MPTISFWYEILIEKAIKKIKAITKYALTGTPIENSLSELWSIFDYIMPGYLFTYKKFKNNYEIPIAREHDEETLNKLKMIIEPFVLRRDEAYIGVLIDDLITKDVPEVILETFAYDGSQSITGATFEWYSLINDVWTIISGATGTSLTLNKTSLL